MKSRQIAPGLSISGQIVPDDLRGLAQAGFRAVICNRPDGEAADQPDFVDIERAAAALGLQARYLPVIPGQLQAEDARRFATLLGELPGPVLAYCRSGTRSANLWALSRSVAGGGPA